MTTKWQSAITFLGGSEDAENKLFEKMAIQVHQEIENIAKNNDGIKRRPQHTKMLAGIKNAVFEVSSNLAQDLQIGFLEKGNSYPTVIRFSNAAAFISEDSDKDLRGVAMEITPTQGNVQDFLMTNAEQHHAKDAAEAMATSLAFYKKGILNKVVGIAELAIHVGSIEALRIIETLTKQTKIPVESLATETFWSRAPFRIGEVVVKYRLHPTIKKNEPEKSNKNLSEDLKSRLKNDEIRFEFQVQRYINEELTPIEDATKAWESSFELVGYVVIPKQDLTDDETFFETLHFNPWKVNTNDFEPIGNMNRARKVIYSASVQTQKN